MEDETVQLKECAYKCLIRVTNEFRTILLEKVIGVSAFILMLKMIECTLMTDKNNMCIS